MAAASLLVRLGVDLGNLKAGVDAATREFDQLRKSVTSMGDSLSGALPKTMGTELKNIAGGVGTLVTSFGGLTAVVGALGIGQLAGEFFDLTGELVDLNAQTDISIKDLQRFKFAAEQSGSSLETITTAIGQLQNRLGSGDKSAASALQALGLSFQEIQRLDPGQQFEAIANAISSVPDPSRRAALAMDLFGRTGISLLPVLRNNLTEVGDQATVLADHTVQAADAFDDMFGRVKNFAKAAVFEGLFGPLVRWADDGKKAVDDLGSSFDALRGKMDALPELKPVAPNVGALAPIEKMSIDDALRLSDQLTTKVEAQIRASESAAQRIRDEWVSGVKRISDAITGSPVKTELAQWAEALRKPGAVAKTLADERLRTDLTQAIDVVTKKFGSLEAAGLKALSPIAAALEAMSQEAETIPPRITETIDVFSEVASGTRDWGEENRITTQTLTDMVAAGQVFKDEVSGKIFKEMRDDSAAASQFVRTLSTDLQFTGSLAVQIGSQFDNLFGGIVSGIGELILSFQRFRKEGVSAYEKIAAAAAGAMATWQATGQQSRAASVGGGALAGAQAGMAFGPYGAAIGAVAGAVVGFVRSADNGRQAVEKFVQDSFGSFDALHSRLNELGAQGEELWVGLTQRVGRGNVEQAKSAIKAIEDALAAHAVKAMEAEAEIGASQQRQADQIDAATDAVRARIQSLDAEYNTLFKSIENEAPEDVIGIVEAATRARMEAIQKERGAAADEEAEIIKKIKDGLGELGSEADAARGFIEDALSRDPIKIPVEFVLPSGLKMPDAGSSASTVPVGGGAGEGGGSGEAVVQVNLDGRQIAEATVRHIPGVLERAGARR